MNKPLIVILTRNYSTGLSVIRSLGAAGYTIDVVASANAEGKSELVALSRYVQNHTEIVSEKLGGEGDGEIVEALLKYRGKCEAKPVLFPTDDYTAAVVDKNSEALGEIFVMPGIDGGRPGELTRLMNKSVQREIALKTGFPVAEEWVVSLREEPIEIPTGITYPCYCKPPESISGYKTEMARCENREELEEHLKKLQERYSDRDFIVQEFLDIDKEIELDGLCCNQKIIVPAVSMNSVVAEHEKGVPVAGELVPFEELGEVKDKVVELLREFRYTGMFDMGLLAVGDKVYFNELNLRSGGPNYAYFASGVNLPELFVKTVTGEEYPPEEEQVDRYGIKYFYEQVGWDDYAAGYLSEKQIDKLIEEADVTFIDNEDDPEPGRLFNESVERKKRRKHRCIEAAVADTGWEADYAEDVINADRLRFDITYKEYRTYKFWRHTYDGKARCYGEIQYDKNVEEIKRERCIRTVMRRAELTREQAEEQIAEAQKRLGISYDDYRRRKFYEIPIEEQESEYLAIKEARKARRETKKKVPEDKSDFTVLVLTRNYPTGLAIIRSLGSAGYTVDIAASVRKKGQSKIASRSKYVNNVMEIVSKKINDNGEAKLVDRLLDYENEGIFKPILFPTDDYTASVIDLNRHQLAKKFIMPSIKDAGNGGLVRSMDKTVQSRIAREAGLPVPEEWIIDLTGEIAIPEDMIYPCFCKPIESTSGYKSEMARCDNEEELTLHLQTLRGKNSNRSVLVQEFLEIDDEIDFSGVCIDDQVIIPAIIRKTAIAQHKKGVTMAGRLVPFEELGEIGENVKNALRAYHYTGMFDMELNIVGDKIYFNEINFRSGGPNYSYFKSGVNLPELFVKAAVGWEHTPEEECVAEYNKTFVYEEVAYEDYLYDCITKKQFREELDKADITLLEDADDPEPGEVFRESFKRKFKKKKKSNSKVMPYLRDMKSVALGYPQTKKQNSREAGNGLPRVLVAGRNYSSNLSIARAAGEAGYETEVMRVFQRKPKNTAVMRQIKPDAYSDKIKAFHICVSNRKRKNIVNKLLRIADPEKKMLLIPADDLVAATIDTYYNELKDYYLMQNVEGIVGEVNKLMNKSTQTRLAKEAGLPVLHSCTIETVNRDFDIPAEVTYPCFVKPEKSVNNPKATMGKCDNEDELRSHFAGITRRKDVKMLVEDYVEIKNEYSILGVAANGTAIGPALFVAEKSGSERRRGVAVTGRILSCDQLQPIVDDCIKFVEKLKFEGLYDIDLIEDVDGNIYFAEMNMRFGASGYAFAKCGANLPGIYADYMIKGVPIDKSCKVTGEGKIFVNEKELMDAYLDKNLTKKEIDEIMDEVDIHFIKNDRDPKPYNHFRKFYKVAAFKRMKNDE